MHLSSSYVQDKIQKIYIFLVKIILSFFQGLIKQMITLLNKFKLFVEKIMKKSDGVRQKIKIKINVEICQIS